MKKTQRKLGLSRETLTNLNNASLYFVDGAATGTCAGSGCASCGQHACNPSNITDPVPVRPGNPIRYITSSAVETYSDHTSSLQF